MLFSNNNWRICLECLKVLSQTDLAIQLLKGVCLLTTLLVPKHAFSSYEDEDFSNANTDEETSNVETNKQSEKLVFQQQNKVDMSKYAEQKKTTKTAFICQVF